MPTDFSGKWVEVKKVNFEPILDLMDLPDPVKKFVMDDNLKRKCTIEQDGDKMKVVADTPKGEKTMEFRVDGTEQDFEDFLKGGKVKSSPKWDGDSLVSDMTMNGKLVQVSRRIEGGQMIMDVSMDGHKAVSYWDKC